VSAIARTPLRPLGLLLAGVLTALVAAWLTPAPAYACSCAAVPEPELIRKAEVIFTWTASRDEPVGDTRTYTFAVDRVYRGQVPASQTVNTPSQSAACGLELTGAEPFLVLGYIRDGVLWADLCGGTRPGAAPAELGVGSPPQAGSAPTGVTWTPASGAMTLLVGAAFIGMAVVIARRRSGGPRA
jgi:hypothetical protein